MTRSFKFRHMPSSLPVVVQLLRILITIPPSVLASLHMWNPSSTAGPEFASGERECAIRSTPTSHQYLKNRTFSDVASPPGLANEAKLGRWSTKAYSVRNPIHPWAVGDSVEVALAVVVDDRRWLVGTRLARLAQAPPLRLHPALSPAQNMSRPNRCELARWTHKKAHAPLFGVSRGYRRQKVRDQHAPGCQSSYAREHMNASFRMS